MITRTCYGCIHQAEPCVARDAFKAHLIGLRITSVKWKCLQRKTKFNVGDPVWVETYESYDRDAERAEFPGTVARVMGGKALVYIRPEARSRCEDYNFEASGNGFCKIPFARLEDRDAPREDICRYCCLPASFGHVEGYSCAIAKGGGAR
ncbi:hypothetical protein [Mesorhizobium sp. L-8-10]|uniref:hypothetical protein n=1 Tax=Mesorhizobium sp. L-8-10 TaxID=2744523 RepID=UPI001928CD3A|nr:hypothetical protein [Mesorhizobium sp. L-8-10]